MSAGRFPEKGTAGNLPSGETYIVPYEGGGEDESRTEGTLPVEIEGELVFFEIKSNRAVRVEGESPAAEAEREHLQREPAYGNMAELGFGVLGDFGLEPIGEILLDEKLGLHVAFGRSDHFGGQVGPGDFSSPQEVIHLDRIYIPATQPRIQVLSVDLSYPDGSRDRIMENGRYLVC
jgi:leucyl aminopeptidase (aminopeptidase T)